MWVVHKNENPLFRFIEDFDPELLPIGYSNSEDLLVYVNINVITENRNINHQSVTNCDFFWEVTFLAGFVFAEDTDLDLEPAPFKSLVVFGDSLSDTGNLFNATEGAIPAPPYFEGRFSDGKIVIDAITEYFSLPSSEPFVTGGTNYAFGGAQLGEGTSEFGLLGNADLDETLEVPNVGEQIDFYLAENTPTENDLFFIYGGVNNFTDAFLRDEVLPSVTEVVENAIAHITELAEAGATTFVVPNLPPIGNIPLLSGQPEAVFFLNKTTDEYNQLLNVELDVLAKDREITIIEPDVNSIVNEIQANPKEFGISNVTDAVLDLSRLGLTVNPEEFFFWDTFHPTASTTEYIAEKILDSLSVELVPFPETLVFL